MSNAGGGLDPNKISSDLIPTTANFFDLGSADRPWKDLHLSGSTLVIGGTELASSELTVLDNVTAGTVAASKAVIVDSNKDITGFRNVNATAISIGGTEVTATATEINKLDGYTGTTANLNVLDFDSQANISSKFLRGDGTYQTVSSGGGGSASESFSTITVAGQSNVVADSSTDTLTLVGTGDTTITTNSGTDTITIDTTVDSIDGGNF